MARLLFITHPQVVIDPAMPVPDWPLSAFGRARMEAFAARLAAEPITSVWSSAEQKARDGARILANRFGLAPQEDPGLGENDRSSTGYIAPPEFWEVVEVFFARPAESVRGWERAVDAQVRIVAAMNRVAAASAPMEQVAVVAHGGVGRLLAAALQGRAIGQEDRPRNPHGGCYLVIEGPPLSLRRSWRDLEDAGAIFD
jgi:broad specificity phosphatase PhoE